MANGGRFAIWNALAVRTDYSASDVRELARRAKDAGQTRRLLDIAAVMDAAARKDAAKLGGMDRQTLRDWVIRCNERGLAGLINVPSPGAPRKLNEEHRAFLARVLEGGPTPAVHGVVRWCACDLIMLLHQEFGISVSDDTIYRALKQVEFLACERSTESLQAEPGRHRRVQKKFGLEVADIRARLAPWAVAG